jgi:sugar phosphate isomerase/epimerase
VKEVSVVVEFGRSARWYNDYALEVAFCKQHDFDFMQVWYKDGALVYDNMAEPKEKIFSAAGFPIIIHALFEVEDYAKYSEDLLRILKSLRHKEVIIHPVCNPLLLKSDTMYKLAEYNKKTTELFYDNGITLYIENNSKLDPLNHTPDELKLIFDISPKTELLLDIAHINSYEHLQNIIDVKYPKCLHIADKHFSVIHEHLPIGHGELDFDTIFANHLKGYTGKIIFEVVTDKDDEIIDGKEIIRKIISK